LYFIEESSAMSRQELSSLAEALEEIVGSLLQIAGDRSSNIITNLEIILYAFLAENYFLTALVPSHGGTEKSTPQKNRLVRVGKQPD